MYNPENPETQGTREDDNQNKITTQYVLDITTTNLRPIYAILIQQIFIFTYQLFPKLWFI